MVHLTGDVADLSVGAGDAVKAADGLSLPDPLPGPGGTVLTAHRPGGLERHTHRIRNPLTLTQTLWEPYRQTHTCARASYIESRGQIDNL